MWAVWLHMAPTHSTSYNQNVQCTDQLCHRLPSKCPHISSNNHHNVLNSRSRCMFEISDPTTWSQYLCSYLSRNCCNGSRSRSVGSVTEDGRLEIPTFPDITACVMSWYVSSMHDRHIMRVVWCFALLTSFMYASVLALQRNSRCLGATCVPHQTTKQHQMAKICFT